NYIDLRKLTSAKDLILPSSIEGDLALDGLVLSEGLVLPKSITMNIYLNGLSTAEKDKLREKYPKFSGKII
ncbi:MAG: hypothetical protein KBD66_03285, partial [Candidatus Doudnabacteria bacterium]|nr:hypothetical protein [Candidatus Doudnabacteria bacterium]